MDAGNPKWSRDGTKILFNDNEEDTSSSANLYTVRVDGGGLTKLTHYAGTAKAFADDWSPDGTRIVFHLVGRDAGGADVNQLELMNADGSGVTPLTHLANSANARNAVWSRSG
jgi:Tol biopolymer transport system component